MANEEIPDEWYFITPPQSVSWTKDSRSNVVETYGTNNPYVHYGTTKLRSLKLGDSMVEGFSDGKVVEQNIIDLEACMRMVLDFDNGYTSPYVWYVYAGNKSYGTYVIESISVNESIRTAEGRASRATVDLSLQEVSPYQVSTGIDITAEVISGGITEKAQKDLEKLNSDNNGNKKGTEAGDQEAAAQAKKDANTPDPNRGPDPGNTVWKPKP
jgi:hypothetical protein